MRFFFLFFFFLISSCAYPDIDSVPNFIDLELSNDELFDLCELSTNDKSELENCIKEKKNIK